MHNAFGFLWEAKKLYGYVNLSKCLFCTNFMNSRNAYKIRL